MKQGRPKAWTDENIIDTIKKVMAAYELDRMPTPTEFKTYFGSTKFEVALRKSGGWKYWAKRIGKPTVDDLIGTKWTEEKIEDAILQVVKEFHSPRMPVREELNKYYGNDEVSSAIRATGGFACWAKKLYLSKRDETERARKFRAPTICWECVHAVPNGKYGCEWSLTGVPVPGWDAVETTDLFGARFADSVYNVMECPKFRQTTGNEKFDPDDIGSVELGLAVVRQACQDYKLALDKYTSMLEKNITKRKLYGRNKWIHIYGARTRGFQINMVKSELKELTRFFNSEYGRHISDLDTVWLMKQIEKEVGRAHHFHFTNVCKKGKTNGRRKG